jgi:cbb3-type cytochrome oxidase subunit 3
MYIDGVVLFSLLMIAMIIVMMGYVAWYFYNHIKQDSVKNTVPKPRRTSR